MSCSFPFYKEFGIHVYSYTFVAQKHNTGKVLPPSLLQISHSSPPSRFTAITRRFCRAVMSMQRVAFGCRVP